MAKPFLSIGIIFRDDIRCLERCLKSLAPLRQAVPSELVMADTGSVDGSREIAEQYADILFDFTWINDFAAARNAVMKRCTGRWYFSIDTDEWLDEDITELVKFIRANNKKAGVSCSLVIRNYVSMGEEPEYKDFLATRMLRMSSGIRFHGTIHESWKYNDGRPLTTTPLNRTLLHHDGYIGLNSEKGAAKRKRNMDLLLAKLEKEPENLLVLMQCIESGGGGAEAMEYIRRGVAATEAKRKHWQIIGPPTYRYAVFDARRRGAADEMLKLSARMEELFPKSFYTLIDVYYHLFVYHWGVTKNNDECIRLGEGYLGAMDDYNAGRGDRNALKASTLNHATPKWERSVRTVLAHAYLRAGQPERGFELLDAVDFSLMDGEQTTNCLLLLKELHKTTEIDTAPVILRLFEDIGKPTPSEKRANERKNIFFQIAAGLFTSGTLNAEEQEAGFTHYSCTMFAPLAGKHEMGDAAAVLMAETAGEKERLLSATEKPYAIHREVLRRAVLSGISFPLREKPLKLEEIDSLAVSLTQKDGLPILKQAMNGIDAGLQQLFWATSVALAVVGSWDWADNEENSEQNMELARTFAQAEEAFISHCYTPEMLSDENVLLLPPIHRFGWYCGRAFQALDAGDAIAYVRLLRAGVEGFPKMKNMVKYLAKHTPQYQDPPQAPPELLEIAKRVRATLARFAPDDPAVAALKASEAYQMVAYLLEK